VGYRLVLTKADKIKASELDDVYASTVAEARKHSAAFPLVSVTSSETGWGLRNCGLRFLGMLSFKKVKGKMRGCHPRAPINVCVALRVRPWPQRLPRRRL
jgi:hypothetical protein